LYSHAVPIAGTRPKIANAVAAKTRFMVASSYLIVLTIQFALNENACQQGVRIAPGTTAAEPPAQLEEAMPSRSNIRSVRQRDAQLARCQRSVSSIL
jgi:hypothetical protein